PLRTKSESGDEAIIASRLAEYAGSLLSVDLGSIWRVVGELRAVRRNGGILYVAGNGGSAATAAHFANDLVSPRPPRAPLQSYALSSNISILTAIANDYGYEH